MANNATKSSQLMEKIKRKNTDTDRSQLRKRSSAIGSMGALQHIPRPSVKSMEQNTPSVWMHNTTNWTYPQTYNHQLKLQYMMQTSAYRAFAMNRVPGFSFQHKDQTSSLHNVEEGREYYSPHPFAFSVHNYYPNPTTLDTSEDLSR